jgi:hypothetical protein
MGLAHLAHFALCALQMDCLPSPFCRGTIRRTVRESPVQQERFFSVSALRTTLDRILLTRVCSTVAPRLLQPLAESRVSTAWCRQQRLSQRWLRSLSLHAFKQLQFCSAPQISVVVFPTKQNSLPTAASHCSLAFATLHLLPCDCCLAWLFFTPHAQSRHCCDCDQIRSCQFS